MAGIIKKKSPHIYAENEPVNMHHFHILTSIEIVPENKANIRVNEALGCNQSETCGLGQTLQVKENAEIMFTVNINLGNRLVNDQLGTIMHISSGKDGNIANIYVNFDNKKASLKKKTKYRFGNSHPWVPIEKHYAYTKTNLKKN